MDLFKFIQEGFWDGTAGGKLAHAKLFRADCRHLLCLRHVQASLKKLPACKGGKSVGTYGAGSVDFCSH